MTQHDRPHQPDTVGEPNRHVLRDQPHQPGSAKGSRRPGLPAGFRIRLDPGARRTDDGLVLVGGAPLRVLRLRPSGRAWLDRLASGEPISDEPAARNLARHLVDCGAAHPEPSWSTPVPTVAVVIPVHDDSVGVRRLLASILDHRPAAASAATPDPDHRPAAASRPVPAQIVVVDDGSADPGAVVAAASDAAGQPGTGPTRVEVVRHQTSRGPAAARNHGATLARSDLVAFVDADVEVSDGWLAPLVAHFADPLVGAVAARVTARHEPVVPGAAFRRSTAPLAALRRLTSSAAALQRPATLARFEAARSPLDLGPVASPVRPGARAPYVPSAALVVRRSALADVGGFDPDLVVGEDVDLVWRLGRSGWTVRYEPAAVVTHRVRPDLRSWLRQRFRYGTSAAMLARRHPGALAPVRVSLWSAAAWAAAALGAPAAGVALAAATSAALVPRLHGLRHPVLEAARLAGGGHLAAGAALAEAARRPWWPITLAAAAAWPRVRPAAAVALLVPPLRRWAVTRPEGLGPAAWLALHVADDVAYGAGVWSGCLRLWTVAPLVPDLSDWPGRRRAVEHAAEPTSRPIAPVPTSGASACADPAVPEPGAESGRRPHRARASGRQRPRHSWSSWWRRRPPLPGRSAGLERRRTTTGVIGRTGTA